MGDDIAHVADQVAAALDAADPAQFADLLHPDVTWGAPGDPSPSCRNRRQVLAWYERGRAAGRRGHVERVTTHGDKILVSMVVTADDATERRWQVLTVADGQITDIRGYDDEQAAVAATRRAGA